MDHVILECMDGDRPSKRGTPGVSVMTALNTFAIPLIRYRVGNICTFLEKKCLCGSSFPLIGPPRGREEDAVRLPSGKFLSSLPFIPILWNISKLVHFRIFQESIDCLVLQIVYRENPQDDMLQKIRSCILEYLRNPVRLDVQIVDFIQEDALKFRTFVSILGKTATT